AMNLAAGFAKGGERTLLIDLDPQCNCTSGLGAAPAENHPLISQAPLSASIQRVGDDGLELLPGSRSFKDVDALARTADAHRATVRRHLNTGMHQYDYVVIDCPPSLGPLTRTALSLSTEVLMPIQCEYFAMEGLTQMIEVIREAMRDAGGRLQFGGIVLTMYDDTLELTHEVETEVRDFFGEIVFPTVVPRDVAVSEAPSHGRSVLDHAPRSRGARAYIELCMEVLERE
ncbi:MAG: ParA family protein, partial [Planctomycetales bacterium]|nr:ParA family protein [Planctomycetales bacterium]